MSSAHPPDCHIRPFSIKSRDRRFREKRQSALQRADARHGIGPGRQIGLHEHAAGPEHESAGRGPKRTTKRADNDDGDRKDCDPGTDARITGAKRLECEYAGKSRERQPDNQRDH